MKRKWMFILAILLPAVGSGLEASAWELNNSQAPGSVLVFPKFIRGTVATPDLANQFQAVSPRTEIEITVSCPQGETCVRDPIQSQLFESVNLKAHWVCPGQLGGLARCAERDFELVTTVNGTVYFNPEGTFPTNASGNVAAPPCERGYLIVWVVDDFDRPIKFDGLLGDAIIRDDGGSAGAYNAIPIQAASYLPNLALTDVDGDRRLDFNADEYKTITGKVLGTVRYETARPTPFGRSQIETYLTLLTLDVLSNRPNNDVFVDLNFYNEFEALRSNSLNFNCWIQVRLTDIDEGLISDFTATTPQFGRKGLVESGPAEKVSNFGIADDVGPVTLLGIVETMERDTTGNTTIREYSYSLYNDTTLVPTEFVPSQVP